MDPAAHEETEVNDSLELADLIGFLHDENEQSNLTETDLSTKMRRLGKEWSP